MASCAFALDACAPLPTVPAGLVAEAHDSRVDLLWDRASDSDEELWVVYRAESPAGPWQRLHAQPHTVHVYSDFVPANDRAYYYRVTRLLDPAPGFGEYLAALHTGRAVDVRGTESAPSPVVEAVPRAAGDDALLDSVQKACFRYFWDFGHPVSGLAREGSTHPRDTVTTGGTGFGMLTILVGVERGFVERGAAARRLLRMVAFLEDRAPRYHGMWAHHLDGATGRTIPFAGPLDDGGDLVESAFLLQGMLTVREYFDRTDPVEAELRARITRLWRAAEWSFYRQSGDPRLMWHWSPRHGFALEHRVDGFNECMIAYLLAMASPTHAIEPEVYYRGWVHDPATYVHGRTHFGIRQPVGPPMGGPLFFTQFSFLALDPRRVEDAYTDYFSNNRAISLIHREYCKANPRGHTGYGALLWGLTASLDPWGYAAHCPGGELDNGTIAPTAALSAMPYTPEASLATLKHLYREHGARLWGPFGFYDAFHPGRGWVSPSHLAIDQGTIAPMIENHRSGMPWRVFMRSDVAAAILRQLAAARAR